jgi:hypothetical protein
MQDESCYSAAHRENPGLLYTGNSRNLFRATVIAIAGSCLFFGFGSLAYTQHTPVQNTTQKEKVMKTHASGTFEVQVKPQAQDDKAADATLGRLSLDKQLHGDLEGTGKGQMLTAVTTVEGSAGYVAIERISGTLHGRKGSFILQHSGFMTRGEPQLTITVVPDSGTDELKGIAGNMTIKITDGKHSYDFEYSLAKTP